MAKPLSFHNGIIFFSSYIPGNDFMEMEEGGSHVSQVSVSLNVFL
jgi:hypothetical protein